MANASPEEIKQPEAKIEQAIPKTENTAEEIQRLIEINNRKLAETRANFDNAASMMELNDDVPGVRDQFGQEYDLLDQQLDVLEKKQKELEGELHPKKEIPEKRPEMKKPKLEVIPGGLAEEAEAPLESKEEPETPFEIKTETGDEAKLDELIAPKPKELEVFGVPAEEAKVETAPLKPVELAPVMGEAAEEDAQKKLAELSAEMALEKAALADRQTKMAELKARAVKEGYFEGYVEQKKSLEKEIAETQTEISDLKHKKEVAEGYEEVEPAQIVKEIVPPPLPKEDEEAPEITVGAEDISLPVEEPAAEKPTETIALKPEESVAAKSAAELAKEKAPEVPEVKSETAVRETAAPEAAAEVAAPAIAAETVVAAKAEEASETGKEDILGAIAAESGLSKQDLAIKGIEKLLNNPELMKDEGAVNKAIDAFSKALAKVDSHMGVVRKAWETIPDPLKKAVRFAEGAAGPLAEVMPIHAALKLGIIEMPGGTITEGGEDQLVEEDKDRMSKLELIVKYVPGLQEIKPFIAPVKKLSETNAAAFARVRDNLTKEREKRAAKIAEKKAAKKLRSNAAKEELVETA